TTCGSGWVCTLYSCIGNTNPPATAGGTDPIPAALTINLNPVIPDLWRDARPVVSREDHVRSLIGHMTINTFAHDRTPLLRKEFTALDLMTTQTLLREVRHLTLSHMRVVTR